MEVLIGGTPQNTRQRNPRLIITVITRVESLWMCGSVDGNAVKRVSNGKDLQLHNTAKRHRPGNCHGDTRQRVDRQRPNRLFTSQFTTFF